MSKKKIAIIRQEQTGSDGGAQAFIDLMLSAVGKNSPIDISLICRKWNSPTTTENIIIIDPPYFGRKNKQKSFNSKTKQYLQKNHFDLIQSHERIDGCHIFRAGDGVHKTWLKQKLKISNKLQQWWIKKSPYHRALLAEEKKMFEGEKLKKVICNSHMVRQEILENFTISEEKVTVIYNGVDKKQFFPVKKQKKEELRKELKIPNNTFTFIFSGSGFERKNLSDTIKAFSKLRKKCHLLVIGRDKNKNRYEKLAKNLGCYDRVTFLGQQRKKDMQKVYQCADILVLPTLYDPFPNVILEAWACGLPCITSKHAGAIDIIPLYQCGTIVDLFNIEQLTKAMQSYTQKEKYENSSKAALNAIKQFSTEKMQEELLLLYKHTMEKK
ncbi:glycosyltransferase family 4 protein [Eionea flava]